MRDLTESIAQLLAVLSEEGDVPIGCDAPSQRLSPDDVNFASSAWLLSVWHIQGWLNLNDSLDRGTVVTAPAAAAAQLFTAMNCPQPADCFSTDDDSVSLTLLGAAELNKRLGTAEKLRALFQEHLEDHSRREATAAWQQGWEEEDDSINSRTSIEQIKAKTDNWRIFDFAGKAYSGRLNLNPSYQRGDVWPNADAQKLIESVVRGIPLPSIIILRPQSQSGTARYEVVDGKQRLTALLRFIGKHPEARRRVEEADRRFPQLNLGEHFQKNYRKFKRLWKAHVGETLTAALERTYYFPFPLGRDPEIFQGYLEDCAGKYFCELRRHEIYVGGGVETVEEVFEGTGEYRIPVIEYTDATARQVHTVFHLYNRQGKHLNAEELRNAVFHELELTRVLLAASGDNTDYAQVVGFLGSDLHPAMEGIAETLREYRFGVQRFKRTKVLSWVVSLLMHPSLENGQLVTRSTARHINELLSAVEESDGTHMLCNKERLRHLVTDLSATVATHSAFDGWNNRFKDNDSGTKWQELQLVASLAAVFLLQVSSEDADGVLEGKRDEVYTFTANHLRPTKTQNKEQWGYIGSCVTGLLQVFGVADDFVDRRMQERYGVSPLATFKAAGNTHQASR
jgi:hypothetical protein